MPIGCKQLLVCDANFTQIISLGLNFLISEFRTRWPLCLEKTSNQQLAEQVFVTPSICPSLLFIHHTIHDAEKSWLGVWKLGED